QAKHSIVKEVRGKGLMIGMELRFEVFNVILKAAERGVLILDAGRNVLRFLPPLVITKTQIDKALSVLDAVLGEEENARAAGSSVPH
ncbi:MAG: aminotransferase class III-fold pyridoxal phosphate-dependent enzyme, partial [Candidatus Bathyarchaeia archaeon]